MTIAIDNRPGLRAATPKARRADRREQRAVVIGLTLFAIYSVAPVWWLIVNATKDRRDLYNSNGLWFAEMNFGENLRQIVAYQDGIFFRWVGNTLLYAAGGAAVATAISIAAGYSISHFRYKGRSVALGVLIGSFLIPSTLITVPLFILFARIGLVDTVWSVLIPLAISPFGVYLCKVYADSTVPAELLEAARLDGASEFRTFWQVVVPMMRTAGATVFVLLFVGNWNNFFLPLTMLRGSDKWPLAVGLYSWFANKNDSIADRTTLTITGALLSVIPLAIVMISMQRYWRSGVAMGALK